MSTAAARRKPSAAASPARAFDMKLEVVVIAVADVDRAKDFYSQLGWRLDADFVAGEEFRGVQFTPPGSPCSIHFGKGITSARPGSADGLYLIVPDVEAARAALTQRGVEVSEVFHRAGFGKPPVSGVHPDRQSYASFASFKDPDGNTWLMQEVTMRLPGRIEPGTTSFATPADLAEALRRASDAHGEHERRIGKPDADWPSWYADYLAKEQASEALPQ